MKAFYLILALPLFAQAQSFNEQLQIKLNKAKENIYFTYGMTFLGPSLGAAHQSGGTYNRFKTGQDYKGDNTDYKASHQVYHGLSTGYKLNNNTRLSFSHTFQDDINHNIEYDIYNKDGSVWKTDKRPQGVSNNNQRINLFRSNIINNKYFYLGSNFFYEMPTTDASKAQEMRYGIGVEPSIGFYNKTPGLYTGINFSIQRNVYKEQEFDADWCKPNCIYPERYQTLLASVSPYASYYISDKMILRGSLTFDWDQKGDQVGTNEFNHNMDNVAELGSRYYFDNNLNFGPALQFALNDIGLDKSAMLFYLSMNI